jgi:protocatechuate 3,4-dioxygenase beta subunit
MNKPDGSDSDSSRGSRLARDFGDAPPAAARRAVLRWLAASGAAAATGALSPRAAKADSAPLKSLCIASAEETTGPFPADGSGAFRDHRNVLLNSAVVRSDIRGSFGGSATIAPGISLQLSFNLLDTRRGCAPFTAGAVYLWSCDRNGDYSLYAPGLEHENYLRGVQFTDSAGQVRFHTVFPACYPGRYPHLHAEIFRRAGPNLDQLQRVLVTQIAVSPNICAEAYSRAQGYERSRSNFGETSMSSDIVFASSSPAQLAEQTLTLTGDPSSGLTGAVNISA